MLAAAYTRIHPFGMAYSGHEARKRPASTRALRSVLRSVLTRGSATG
jgi:hypothetical protein